MVTAQGVNLQELSIKDWTGEIHGKEWINYIDGFLLILCGGIPWQPYHQRALAVTSTKRAQILSVMSTIGCLTLMIHWIYVHIYEGGNPNDPRIFC